MMNVPFPDAEIPTDALHAFHQPERRLYRRLVLELDIDPVVGMELVAFWLWQEEMERRNVIKQMNEADVLTIHDAAVSAVDRLDGLFRAEDPQGPLSELESRDKARYGIGYFYRIVCVKIFDDIFREAEEARRRRRQMDILIAEMNRTSIGQTPARRPNPTLTRSSQALPLAMPSMGVLGAYGTVAAQLVSRAASERPISTPYSNGEGSSRGTSGTHHQIPEAPPIAGMPPPAAVQRAFQGSRNLNMGIFGVGGGDGNLLLPPGITMRGNQPSYHMAGTSLGGEPQTWPSPTTVSDVPQDERTLFITFSHGYPLTEDELYTFFARNWGGVESVYIEEPHEKPEGPMYARVSFYTLESCLRVLNGKDRAKFKYKGKHVWTRRYIPGRLRRLGITSI